MSEGAARQAVEAEVAAPRGVFRGQARWAYGRDFWLVFIASFALNFSSNLFALFPLWIVQLGGGASVIGAIVGTGSLAALSARPAAGATIDRRGRRWTAFWFLVLDAAAIGLYLPIGALGWPVYLVRVIHGAVEGTARVALFAMVFDILPEGRQGEGMAIFSLCGVGAAAFAPLCAELLIHRAGFGAFFGAAMALAGAGALAIRAEHADRHAPRALDEGAAVGYRALLADRGLRPLWVVALLFALVTSSRTSFLAPFAYAEGLPSVGWYFVVFSMTAVVVRASGARLIDRVGLKQMLVPSLCVLGVGLGLLAGTGWTGMLYWAAVIGGIGHAYAYPVLSALVIERTRAGAMGRSSTIYISLYDLGTMAGPYGLGTLGEYLGYGAIFLASGAISFLAGVYYALADWRSGSDGPLTRTLLG